MNINTEGDGGRLHLKLDRTVTQQTEGDRMRRKRDKGFERGNYRDKDIAGEREKEGMQDEDMKATVEPRKSHYHTTPHHIKPQCTTPRNASQCTTPHHTVHHSAPHHTIQCITVHHTTQCNRPAR